MILLGQIDNPRACKAFTDYLSVQGIQFQVKAEASSLAIYVEEQHFEQSQQLFDEFLINPNQEKYLQASWQLNQPLIGRTQSLGLSKIWQANGPITKFITLICVGIYCLSIMGYFEGIFTSLSFSWQLESFYRLFTPAIMHLSAMHLAFNICWWWYLGGKVENHLGYSALIIITLFTALASNVSQALLVDNNFAGLSGVTYGLAGFVWLYGKLTQDTQVYLPNNVFGFLLVWMVLGFANVLPINMANWAHLFGLLAGMLVAMLLKNRHKKGTN